MSNHDADVSNLNDLTAMQHAMAKALRPMQAALQLIDWTITLHFDSITSDDPTFRSSATCHTQAGYKRASITVDVHNIADVDESLWVLRHELLHVWHAEFVEYRGQIAKLLDDDAYNATNQSWHYAAERFVNRAESFFDHTIGWNPRALVKAGQAKLDHHYGKPSTKKRKGKR